MATTDTNGLTTRQRRILEFIARTVRERGYPPTVREIGEAVGLTSSSSVHAQLANLERRGLLHKDPTKPRAMALEAPRAGRSVRSSPIAASRLAEQHVGAFVWEAVAPKRAPGSPATRCWEPHLDRDIVVVRR
jgi:SOS-response transcriptional repressor LexA